MLWILHSPMKNKPTTTGEKKTKKQKITETIEFCLNNFGVSGDKAKFIALMIYGMLQMENLL